MSRDEKGYNGCCNYETWRVMLEIFDGHDPDGQWMTREAARDMAEEWILEPMDDTSFAAGVVWQFLHAVEWQEIADAINETWETPNPDATDEATP